MGGSGGGYIPNAVTARQLASRTREAESRAQGDAFETDVGECLADLLSDYNGRDADATQRALSEITSDIEGLIEGSVDTLFGGSVSKHTYVDGISDIDALLLLDSSDLADRTPAEVRSFLAQSLRERYPGAVVHEGDLAVTLSRLDRDIQLLPALRVGDRFRISSNDGQSWSTVNPAAFASALTEANQRLSGKLVPCIKLAKAIVATLPEKRRTTGYHTESLALNVFRQYDGPKTSKAMLQYFFENVPSQIVLPIKDRSGQSAFVDDYLGERNSLHRRTIADSFSRVARRIKNANGARSIELWKRLFE